MSAIRYILYARKFEEDKNRQVQSIGDQIKELHRLAERKGLLIVDEVREEFSAKAPGRPLFNAMLKRIVAGEADGILVWSINRLLRNPIDQGTVSWMLQQGQIRSIQTMDKEYLPGDNVVLLSVESAVANQFIIDLRKGTLRGLASKIEKGWFPHKAPLGYLNNRLDKTIEPDPVRFAMLRQAWDLLLSGTFSVTAILDKLNNEMGFRVPATKGEAGGPLSRSTLYNLFNNIFYAGYFHHNGMLHRGAHQAMISLDDYQRAQDRLNSGTQRRAQKHEFAFTGLIRCGHCGQAVTADLKTKFIRGTGERRSYVYYHCSDSFGTCHKRGVREDDLAKNIDELLEKLTILPEFKEWGIEEIRRWRNEEETVRQTAYQQKQNALVEVNRQLDNLLDLRLKDVVSDEDYTRKRDELAAQRNALHFEADHVEQQGDLSREAVENALEFAVNARAWFAAGDVMARRAIAQTVGTKFVLEEKKITIEPNPVLVPLLEEYQELEAKYRALEPLKSGSGSQQSAALRDVRLSWGGIVDNTRTAAGRLQIGFPKIGTWCQTMSLG